ncbi:hypothetical protein M569_07670 [Genlisea aurea]|uniref:Uncharacterized protein n=1 Tax=Genlisea aurea TaxID=192259 RepID=S8CQF3_9LAMI|nr:hypothetical protein M569_07670 [Genlisea aurea]
MKGGKDEWKSVEPLFPKLHLNEVDKGGPRAPPRNKMAVSHQYNNLLSSRRPPEMFQIRPLPTPTVCPKGSLDLVCSASQRPVQRYNAISGGSSVGEFSILPNHKNDEDQQQQVLLNLMKRPQPYVFRSCSFSTTDDDKQNPPFPRFPDEFHEDSCLKHRRETGIEDKAVVDLTETDRSSSISRENRYSTTGRSSSPALRKREFGETDDPSSWYFTNRDLPLTPEDVVRVIGRKPFLIAKQTLLQ